LPVLASRSPGYCARPESPKALALAHSPDERSPRRVQTRRLAARRDDLEQVHGPLDPFELANAHRLYRDRSWQEPPERVCDDHLTWAGLPLGTSGDVRGSHRQPRARAGRYFPVSPPLRVRCLFRCALGARGSSR